MTTGICHWFLKPDRLDPPSSLRKGELTLIEYLLGARHFPKCFTSMPIEFSLQPWKEGWFIVPSQRLRNQDLGTLTFENFSKSSMMRMPKDYTFQKPNSLFLNFPT